MAYEFYLGVDPSDESEKVTIALVEKSEYNNRETPTYHVRRLERRDGMDEEKIAEYIQDLIADEPYVGRTMLVVNRTRKPGRRLLSCLVEEGLTPIGATITGGDSKAQRSPGLALGPGHGGDSADDEGGFIVSEHELVETIEELYHDGQLKMEQDSEEVSALAHGIQSYEAAAGEAGVALNRIDLDPERAAAHDSLVLGTALACWYGEQHTFDTAERLEEYAEEPPTTGTAKRILRPDIET